MTRKKLVRCCRPTVTLLANEGEASRAVGRGRFAAFIARISRQPASRRRSLAAEEGQ